jgi:Flp pilus assembly pilin Flp
MTVFAAGVSVAALTFVVHFLLQKFVRNESNATAVKFAGIIAAIMCAVTIILVLILKGLPS